MRYIRLLLKLFKYNLKLQMQYRANFLLSIPMHLSWTIKEVLVVFILYQYTQSIYGWDKYEFIFLLGTYFLIDSLFSCMLLPNLSNLSQQIQDGTFDHILLKPIDSQFYTMTYSFNMGVLSALAVGFFLIIYASFHITFSLSPLRILLYVLLMVSGIIIYACILFICASLSFKTVKADYIRNIFVGIANIARKPISIFPKAIQDILYLIPIAYIAYIPACYYLGKIDIVKCLISFPVSFLFSLICRFIWNRSVDDYTSIS